MRKKWRRKEEVRWRERGSNALQRKGTYDDAWSRNEKLFIFYFVRSDEREWGKGERELGFFVLFFSFCVFLFLFIYYTTPFFFLSYLLLLLLVHIPSISALLDLSIHLSRCLKLIVVGW